MSAKKLSCTNSYTEKKSLNLKLQPDVPLIQHFLSFDEIIAELIPTGEQMSESGKISYKLTFLPDTYNRIVRGFN